jgi:hypothetical protein
MEGAMSDLVYHEIVDKNGEHLTDYPGKPEEHIPATIESIAFRASGVMVIRVRLTDWENPK